MKRKEKTIILPRNNNRSFKSNVYPPINSLQGHSRIRASIINQQLKFVSQTQHLDDDHIHSRLFSISIVRKSKSHRIYRFGVLQTENLSIIAVYTVQLCRCLHNAPGTPTRTHGVNNLTFQFKPFSIARSLYPSFRVVSMGARRARHELALYIFKPFEIALTLPVDLLLIRNVCATDKELFITLPDWLLCDCANEIETWLIFQKIRLHSIFLHIFTLSK